MIGLTIQKIEYFVDVLRQWDRKFRHEFFVHVAFLVFSTFITVQIEYYIFVAQNFT